MIFAPLRDRPSLFTCTHRSASPSGTISFLHWTRDRRLADRIERLIKRADLVISPSELLADDLAAEGTIRDRDAWIVAIRLSLPGGRLATRRGRTPSRADGRRSKGKGPR